MLYRKTLLAVAIAAAASTIPAVSQAERYVVVTPPSVTYTTPEPVYETVPAPREGYVWQPGYWARDGDRQVWISGHFVYDRDYYVLRDRHPHNRVHRLWDRVRGYDYD